MPYMTRPDLDIPLWYGVKLVRQGELVLVNEGDVAALLAEGWQIHQDPDTTNATPLASDED